MSVSNEMVIPLLRLSGLLSLAVAYLAWRRRPAPGAQEFALLSTAGALWSIFYSIGLGGSSLEWKVFWNNLVYLAIVFIPVLWLLFSLRYTAAVELDRSRVMVLLALPLLTTLVVWTNPLHGLFWSEVSLRTEGSFTSLLTLRSAWFWVHTAYSYACLLVGTFLLLRSLVVGRAGLYRGQAAALAVGVFAPWIANAAYIFNLFPVPLLDPTPFGFTVTNLSIAWALYRFGLLDIMPAARDAVLASMTDGVIVLDARSRIVEINPAAEQFLQQGSPGIKNLIGRDALEILRPWPEVVARFQDTTRAYASAVPFPFEKRTRYLDVRISPITDRSGRITGRVLVTSDVTHRKLAGDLQKAKETAEAASRAKSAFLASMSHELRTPLNHITGYSELLMEEVELNQHQHLYTADLHKIHRAGAHLLSIITQILELARLEAGMVVLQPEPVSLRALAHEVVQGVLPLAEQNGSQVQIQLPEQDVHITTDPHRLRQVLAGLLDNAARFTSGGQILFSLCRLEHEVVLEVQDTGPGIPPEQLGTLFEAFSNPDSASRSSSQGLGLGLAAAQHLARLMDGEIRVRSEPGRGSAFTLHLPLAAE
jgi:PAS domain S-box-containing protein